MTEPAERTLPFACIVLAAGAGTRFGEPKAGAELRPGVRFLDAVVESAADAGSNPIVAVVPESTPVPPPARAAVNPNPRSEQVSSLRLGLAQLANAPVVGTIVWPVDHPFVEVETVRALLDAFRRSGAPVVVPLHEGSRGHPVFFARETWLELMTVPSGGARAVVHAHGAAVHDVIVPDRGILRNIDTRADLRTGQET